MTPVPAEEYVGIIAKEYSLRHAILRSAKQQSALNRGGINDIRDDRRDRWEWSV